MRAVIKATAVKSFFIVQKYYETLKFFYADE